MRRHGQLWFTRLAHAAGADGVEVRGELLTDPASELPALAQAVREAGLQVVYSSPEGLWRGDGSARQIRAGPGTGCGANPGRAAPEDVHRRLRRAVARTRWLLLKQLLASSPIELLIENDQTAAAGSLAALKSFFAAAAAHDLPLGMTFDMGNWHWVGECPLQAAQALAPRVRYVHCKGVQRQPLRWVAVPLAESAAPWRAVLRALPADVPWAIEYPLAGDDLLAVTRAEVGQLRAVAAQSGAAA